jgi:protein-export membrane protein SecD
MAVKQQAKNVSVSSLRWRLAGIGALAVFCLIIIFPVSLNKGISWVNQKANLGLPTLPEKGFSLGLDLQGGAHLIYQTDTSNIPGADKASAVEGVRDVIERRVRGGLGVAEPLVQTTKVGEDYRVIIELPGVTDVNQAIKMIGETPILEFKEENNEPPRDLTADEKKQMNEFNAVAQKKANEALAAMKKGMAFDELVTKYSEDEKSKNNYGNLGFIDNTVYPALFDWAAKHKDGEVGKELVKSFDGLNIVKRISSKDGEKEVEAQHLLICYMGAQGCDNAQYTKDQALAKIQELKKQATTANFTELVKKNSTEPGAAEKAGELGYFKEGDMIKEFAQAAFAMPSGTISDPVETAFGYHLIYKKGERVPKLYEVARVFIKTKQATDIVPPSEQWKTTGLSGKQLKRAEVSEDYQTGQVQVALQFDDEGTKLFADITKRNVSKPVAIFLDGEPISVPTVNEPILTGSAVISGSFTLQEAKLLAQRLNSGALPVPVELISQQKVDATLGMDSLQKSFKAGLIGMLLVLIYMILYYRLPGFLAAISLCLYAILTLAIFKLIGVTLTLSGIAGFILSIGMAVDANVLVFERLKEELREGRNLRSAMEESFIRAWPSIRDSNITTLISCVFLIWLGGGFVQGFAVTLAIGVLASMFTAITITRSIMRMVLRWFKEGNVWLFLGYTKPSIQENKDK